MRNFLYLCTSNPSLRMSLLSALTFTCLSWLFYLIPLDRLNQFNIDVFSVVTVFAILITYNQFIELLDQCESIRLLPTVRRKSVQTIQLFMVLLSLPALFLLQGNLVPIIFLLLWCVAPLVRRHSEVQIQYSELFFVLVFFCYIIFDIRPTIGVSSWWMCIILLFSLRFVLSHQTQAFSIGAYKALVDPWSLLAQKNVNRQPLLTLTRPLFLYLGSQPLIFLLLLAIAFAFATLSGFGVLVIERFKPILFLGGMTPIFFGVLFYTRIQAIGWYNTRPVNGTLRNLCSQIIIFWALSFFTFYLLLYFTYYQAALDDTFPGLVGIVLFSFISTMNSTASYALNMSISAPQISLWVRLPTFLMHIVIQLVIFSLFVFLVADGRHITSSPMMMWICLVLGAMGLGVYAIGQKKLRSLAFV